MIRAETLRKPVKVTGFTALGQSPAGQRPPNSLLVSWDVIPGADGYKMQWKSGNEDWDALRQQAAGTSAPSATIPGLSGGVGHSIRVTATKSGGDDSDPSGVVLGTPLKQSPSVTGVAATPTGAGSLLVTWDLSEDPGVIAYEIH